MQGKKKQQATNQTKSKPQELADSLKKFKILRWRIFEVFREKIERKVQQNDCIAPPEVLVGHYTTQRCPVSAIRFQ